MLHLEKMNYFAIELTLREISYVFYELKVGRKSVAVC